MTVLVFIHLSTPSGLKKMNRTVEYLGALPPDVLVRVREEDDDDGDRPLGLARRVQNRVERLAQIVGRLLKVNAY